MKRISYAIVAAFLSFCSALGQETAGETALSCAQESSVAVDSVASTSWEDALRAGMEQLLAADMFATSQVGVMIYDLDADSVLFRRGEKQLLRPASTMKLVTAITALDRLGGGHQFLTELRYSGAIEGNVLRGDVYCVGGFDPRFNADDMRAFVESLRRHGIDTIRGALVADKTMKNADRFGKGWCWDDDNPVLSPLLINGEDSFVVRLRGEICDAGVVVEGAMEERAKPATTFALCRRFHTIDQILMKMMKESDNLYAEAMLYQIAASTGKRCADASDAAAIISRLVAKVGLQASQYTFADGSGLSLYDYVSAEMEVALLRYAYQNNNIYLHLLPSLPVAGVDGTLKGRMGGAFTGGNVRAKTGSVTGVSSLAGYCTAANGHRIAFAIINQGLPRLRPARDFQDRVCSLICRP